MVETRDHKGFTLWLTGLPSAGKTTLAHLMGRQLQERGFRRVEILDGDVIRTNLCKDLGFSREDRNTNIRRIAYVCGLLTRNDVVTIVAAISPYRESREFARKQIERFVEVHVKCPIDIAIQRDVKGLYRKALQGEIPAFTGVSDPYEEPSNPEIVVETHLETPEQSAERILKGLVQQGWLEDGVF